MDFNDEVSLRSDLTTDLDRARNALIQVGLRGGSALRDAIKLSAGVVERKALNRRILVLISDGSDSSSAATEEQVRDSIRNSGALVYSIALGKGQDIGKAAGGERILTQLAALSGGRSYHPEAPAEVEDIASGIVRDARNK